MSALRLGFALLATLVVSGCTGDDDTRERGSQRARDAAAPSAAGAARRPRLCRSLRARVTGRVATPAASELSGLVLSRSQTGVLWSHNDSGDAPRLLALSPRGRLWADLSVAGAEHVDWEDIATGPAAGPRDALYVGDIGDNAEERPQIVVYRLSEPRVHGRAPAASRSAVRFALRYPDRPHDAEALLVDPSSGALIVVTKDFGGSARLYVAARPSARAVTTMRRAGTLRLGAGQAVTAGDISADGRTVAVRTYDGAFVWSRRRAQSLSSAMRARPCAARAGLLAEGQGEALALTRDGRAFFTVAEGRRPPFRRYAPR